MRTRGRRPLEGESQQMTASVVTHIPHTSPQRGKKWVHGHNNNARALQSPGKIPLPHKWCKSETMVAYSPGCPTPPTWPHPQDPEVQTGHPNMGQCTLHGMVTNEACTTPTRRDPARDQAAHQGPRPHRARVREILFIPKGLFKIDTSLLAGGQHKRKHSQHPKTVRQHPAQFAFCLLNPGSPPCLPHLLYMTVFFLL